MSQSLNSKISNSLFEFVKELYPVCRSITGNGTRETLSSIKNIIPLDIKEIPTGSKVFDWEIPKEWNIKDAYVKNSDGKRIIDFKKSNLHVMSYSAPINRKMSLTELQDHLHTLPNLPDWTPYKTSYYKEDWGFCLTHNNYLNLKEDLYEVVIDSKLTKGYLTYGEYFKKGKRDEEVLISTHICHPSMCNDNLSGISVATFLAQYLENLDTNLSYRILFIPATIGAITWLALNQDKYERIKYGLVIALLGDDGIFHYKKSKEGSTKTDKIMEYILKSSRHDHKILDFQPYGYDERQFCSPGINLPVGRLTRSPNQHYKEYHTSADDLNFISEQKLFESLDLLSDFIRTVDSNQKYLNLYPNCEPQLGKRGIYNSVAGKIKEIELAMLWILNCSDGNDDLVDIGLKSGIKLSTLLNATEKLLEHKIIKHQN
ncbi:MAG: DUF4910 domain-containing protein [Ignavibacteriales bacterium]|nr:DUF4910 domain-containing protein [Ignavibacteriales bacterium]